MAEGTQRSADGKSPSVTLLADLATDEARQVPGAQGWAIVPAADGACLVAPEDAVVCVSEEDVAAGKLMAMKVDHGDNGEPALSSIVGVVPDEIAQVRAVNKSGSPVVTAEVDRNAYTLDLAGKETAGFEFVLADGAVRALRP
jgi:hypothetical protein